MKIATAVAALVAALVLLGPATARAGSVPAATVEAREAFFGERNVDRRGRLPRDRVIVSWFGVSSLAVSFAGRVVLLDTFVNNAPPATCGRDGSPPARPSASGYTPTSYAQLIALRPRAIFIGHGHFDHACMTGTIAARTGARVVALPQDCARARADAAAAGLSGAVRCVSARPARDRPGASRTIRPLGRRVAVTAIRNLHSGLASREAPDEEGAASLMFRFDVGRFSMVWNDTAGAARERGPKLLARLRRAAPADVQFGATLGLGVGEQGMRDAADYAEALRVRRFYPLHQDLLRDPATSRGFVAQARAEFERRGLGSAFRSLRDPDDYLRPIVFAPAARRWAR